MNTHLKPILLTLICLTYGCKSITERVFHNNQQHQVAIGTIGVEKNTMLKSTYNSLGFLNLQHPLKLEVTGEVFTNKTHKDFKNAKASQASELKMVYNDSLESKPRYLSFRMADILSLIALLNSRENDHIKSYLETNELAGIITSVSMVYQETIVEEFLKAESVFLVQSGDASYHFQLHQRNKAIKTISFKDGVTMDYKLSKPCWKSVRQNTVEIVDLKRSGDKCSFGTYKAPRYIKKETDYFKF